jgi:hypothetical protein
MIMTNKYKIFIFALFLTFVWSCTKDQNNLTVPIIKYGTAKIAGKIAWFDNLSDSAIQISVSYPVTDQIKFYESKVKENGSFQFEFPVESASIADLSFDGNSVIIGLIPDHETKINIQYMSQNQMRIQSNNKLGLTDEDMSALKPVMKDILNSNLSGYFVIHSNTSPDRFRQAYNESLDSLYNTINSIQTLSKNAKLLIYKLFTMHYLYNTLNPQKNILQFEG